MQILSQTYFRMVTVGIYFATAFRQLGIHQKFFICKEKVIGFSLNCSTLPTAVPALLSKISLELHNFLLIIKLTTFSLYQTSVETIKVSSVAPTYKHKLVGQNFIIATVLVHLCY